MSGKKYTFLLAGKTGVGKSSVGNSILGVEKFKVSDSDKSETLTINMQSAVNNGNHITVIDTPGFMGTELRSVDAKSKAIEYMKKTMSKCPTDGKIAVILVIRYGDRFTNEQVESLYILQNIFGEKDLWSSCIIVMTNGDSFDQKYKGAKPFDQYICEQVDFFGGIFEKSGGKCILFRNLTDKTNEKEAQLNELIESVDNLKEGYTKSKFEEAKKERNRLKLQVNLPALIDKFKKTIDDIKSQVTELELGSDLSSQKLKELNIKVSEQLAIIEEKDSPKKIFYHKREERLLKNIHDEFFKLQILISDKDKKSKEAKMAKDFANKIKIIDGRISQGQETRIDSKEFIDCEKELEELEVEINKCEFQKTQLEELKILISKEKDKIYGVITIRLIQKVQDITSEIDATDSRCNNVLEKITKYSEMLNNLKSEIDTTSLSTKYASTIPITLHKAEKSLHDLEEKSSRDIHSDFQDLSQEIDTTKPDDPKIKDKLCDIESNFNKLTRRVGKTNTELNTKCFDKLAVLKQRVSDFLDVKSKIGNIISKVNDLGIPCRVSHFLDLKENANGVLTVLLDKVKNEQDKNILKDELQNLIKEIKKKKVRNDWEIAGKVISYLPLFGPVLQDAFTVGNNAEEAKQRNALSSTHTTNSTE